MRVLRVKYKIEKTKRGLYLNGKDLFWSWIGAFFGIGAIGFISEIGFTQADALYLIGSFGASAVLVYGAIYSPLAQPRNLFGGHLISAIVGVTVFKIIPDQVWLSSAISVATSITLMQITRTVHPPGGATALIANIGSEKIKSMGYLYVLFPVFTGVMMLFMIAMFVNNIPKGRKYPDHT